MFHFQGESKGFRFGFSQGLNALPNDDQRGRYITIIGRGYKTVALYNVKGVGIPYFSEG